MWLNTLFTVCHLSLMLSWPIQLKQIEPEYQVCVAVKLNTTQNISGNIPAHHTRDSDLQHPIWKGILSQGQSLIKYHTMKAYGRSGGKLGISWRCVVSRVPCYWDPCTYGYPTITYSQLPFAAPQPISLSNYVQCTFHYVPVIPDSGLKDSEIKHRDKFTFTSVLADCRIAIGQLLGTSTRTLCVNFHRYRYRLLFVFTYFLNNWQQCCSNKLCP
jgi:hypothetical protein